MSLLTLRTQNLSWQDRTINIELMVAPARTQLLYNKHKGLRTKCDQVSDTLDKERTSFMRSFETEQRLMQRRKTAYSQRRNDIIMRRNSTPSRHSSVATTPVTVEAGRLSAPPRLQNDLSKRDDKVFLTQLSARESKSAGARFLHPLPAPADGADSSTTGNAGNTNELPVPVTFDDIKSTGSPCVSARSRGSATPGRPHLVRDKGVRFMDLDKLPVQDKVEPPLAPELCITDRVQRFLSTQTDFNKGQSATSHLNNDFPLNYSPRTSARRRRSSVHNGLIKLESAFDDFCQDTSPEKLQSLVKFATRMKMSVRGLRSNSMIPPIVGKSVTLVT